MPKKDLSDWLRYGASIPHIGVNEGSLQLYREIAPRSSGCRVCGGRIKKGESRMVLFMRLPWKRKFPKGGSSRWLKVHWHEDCFTAALYGDEKLGSPMHWERRMHTGEMNECFDCGTAVDRAICDTFAWWMYGHRPLCMRCSSSGRYRKCVACSLMTPRRYTSFIAFDTHGRLRGDILCDSCATNDRYHTERSLNAEHRRMEQRERKFEQIREVLDSWVSE